MLSPTMVQRGKIRPGLQTINPMIGKLDNAPQQMNNFMNINDNQLKSSVLQKRMQYQHNNVKTPTHLQQGKSAGQD